MIEKCPAGFIVSNRDSTAALMIYESYTRIEFLENGFRFWIQDERSKIVGTQKFQCGVECDESGIYWVYLITSSMYANIAIPRHEYLQLRDYFEKKEFSDEFNLTNPITLEKN